ncbi:unnamed protein product [Arabidopsis thaliana]|uniref:(thale cress) hypothetical protein n=1 Tax=Arabidopsis thaliana TaxID=3702 RepID=A0A7G2E012_ARATH|nr:unnamed protein product [Arabidopsis thaliana]
MLTRCDAVVEAVSGAGNVTSAVIGRFCPRKILDKLWFVGNLVIRSIVLFRSFWIDQSLVDLLEEDEVMIEDELRPSQR